MLATSSRNTWRHTSLFAALLLGAAVGGTAQGIRTEIHSFQSTTMTDQDFLTGRKEGKPVALAGVLRLPRPGTDRLPVVVLLHGSGGISGYVTDWEQDLLAMGVATFVIDAFTARGIVNTNYDQTQLGRLAMIYDAYRVLRQVDQAIGGAQGGSAADTNRAAFARRVSARASAEVGQDPGNLLARYELAFGSWFLETDHHTAMREMLEINRQDPHNAMNHGFLGYVYADRKDAPNTIAQWEEATRLDPSNSLLHYMLGLAYSHVGRSRDAALQFAQAYRDRTLYNYITRGEQP